jgi:NADH-quinone oxidoreductase subunit I
MQYGKWDLMNTYAEIDGKERISQDPTPTVPRRTIVM